MPRFRRSYRKGYAKNKLVTNTMKASKTDVVQNKELIKMKKDLGRLKREAVEYKITSPISVNAGTVVSLVDTPNPASGILSGIAVGTAVNQRTGDRITANYLTNRYFATAQIALSQCYLRHVVFWDRDPVNGAPATWNEVFGGTAGNEFIWLPLFENRYRFTIIRDKTMSVGTHPIDNAATARGVKFFSSKTNLKRQLLKYEGANAGDVIGKHLYSFMVTNISNVAGASIQQNWESDLYWIDN